MKKAAAEAGSTGEEEQRKRLDSLRQQCATLRQEISTLELKEKELIKLNKETSSTVAKLEAGVALKEEKLNRAIAVSVFQKDKINRLMLQSQMTLLRKVETESTLKEEQAKRATKQKETEQMNEEIRERALRVLAKIDEAPWMKTRQKIVAEIEDLKKEIEALDSLHSSLQAELEEKMKIVKGHQELPLEKFCKMAAGLSLRNRTLLSKLATKLVQLDKLSKAQASQESLQISSVDVTQSTDNSDLNNCHKPESQSSTETANTASQAELVDTSKAVAKDPSRAVVVDESMPLQETLEDSCVIKTVVVSENGNECSPMDTSTAEQNCSQQLDDVSFNQSVESEMDEGFADIEEKAASVGIFKVPEPPRRRLLKRRKPADPSPVLTPESPNSDSGDHESADGEFFNLGKDDAAALARMFDNMGEDNAEFDISSVNASASESFNPSALLNLSATVKAADGGMDFMAMFGGEEEEEVNFDANNPYGFQFDDGTSQRSSQSDNNSQQDPQPFSFF